MNAPITEKDKPSIDSIIQKLTRFRKREHASNNNFMGNYLTNAIKELMVYGLLKGWWDTPE